jgi:hypothetical protein
MLPRVEYIRYVYKTSDYLFENFQQPIAVYKPDGQIVSATKDFRELAGIIADDIENGGANLYECLNDGENPEIIDNARAVFNNFERIVKDTVCLLRPVDEWRKRLLEDYRNAVFFPLEYLDIKKTAVDCCAVLFIREPLKDAPDDGGGEPA